MKPKWVVKFGRSKRVFYTNYHANQFIRALDLNGTQYTVEKIEGKRKNPSGTWFKLDHPHAIAVVNDEIQLMSSKPLTNPQRKKFRSFVSKIKKALSNKRRK